MGVKYAERLAQMLSVQMMYRAEWSEHGWRGGMEPYQCLQVDPAAQVLNYGQSIFEGLKAQRTVDDKVVLFRPNENAKRMRAGMPLWLKSNSRFTWKFFCDYIIPGFANTHSSEVLIHCCSLLWDKVSNDCVPLSLLIKLASPIQRNISENLA